MSAAVATPARPTLTPAEIAFVRSIQVELGAVRLCRMCGQRLPVAAFPGYGASACSECQGLHPWLVG